MHVNDIMESLTIEIHSAKFKSIFLSCMYRTPGSCIDNFTNTSSDILGKICGKKNVVVGGDFNIDLLKWNEHKLTNDFCNTMFSFRLWPLNDKPKRTTKESVTLIDNIFTNAHEKLTSGLLTSDISDHLPIFVNLDNYNVNGSVSLTEPIYKLVRIRTPERTEALKLDLASYNWDEVYVYGPNQAYDAFLFGFLEVYNKHCPVRKYLVTENKYNGKPWLTKSLQKACRKKNSLYKTYLQLRTSESEEKYKQYKNKLTSIIRNARKKYYNKILEDNKNNIQRTWKVINHIIYNRNYKSDFPSYFLNKSDVAVDNLNYFVNVGSTLASKILVPGDKKDMFHHLIDVSINFMFLCGVNEIDIIETIRKLKNKTSDIYTIDMKIIKEVTYSIVRPLTYICNQSLRRCVFPNGMKTVSLLYPYFLSFQKYYRHCQTIRCIH